MNINHHPCDSLLMSYAAGNLNQGFSLVVASHASMCSQCSSKIIIAENIGGVLLDELTPVEMRLKSIEDLFESIDDEAEEKFEESLEKVVQDPEIPSPLYTYLNSSLDNLKWKTLVPGIKHIQLDAVTGKVGTVRLFKISPGKSLLSHTHSGMEMSLVLRGSYSDETGRFKRGDTCDLDKETTHQPFTDTNEDCICLIATEGPLIYEGALGKILQPFIGI